MDRAQKKELVASLNRVFSETGVVVITRNHGLTVAQVTDLRNKMRAAGASYKVAKNKLARIAWAVWSREVDFAPAREAAPMT